jgi:general stress protein 26
MAGSAETERKARTLDELIDEFDTAMLVTQSLEGELRSRPMMIAEHETRGVLYFATRAEDKKLEEVLKNPHVAVTMQAPGRYLSISGRATIDTDVTRADELWSASWRLWFPEGTGDPQLTLIAVEPSHAEYWDRTGLHRLEFLWKAGKALLRGDKAADDELGGHAKVDLESPS